MTRFLLLGGLLVANLIAFGIWSGWLDAWLPGTTEPQRLASQVAPDRVKVVPAPVALKDAPPSALAGAAERAPDAAATTAAANAAAGPAPVAAAAPAPGPASAPAVPSPAVPAPAVPAPAVPAPAVVAPVPAKPPVPAGSSAASAAPGPGTTSPAPAPKPTPAPTPTPTQAAAVPVARDSATASVVCVAAGPLDEARAERARAWARKLTGGLQGKVDRRAESTSYMVYVPASRTQADAQRRFDQLRQSGLTDIFLITEGSLRLAISLGIFRSQDGARAQIEALGARGLENLRIASIPGRTDRVWATLTRTASVADGPWDAARAQLKELAGSTPAACTP